ncbi:hypothetical protein [Vibrio sp. HN007]|uniref:hypothetical protein n=1 Tax=Vibrio iocasae TaxID=3098914 RepID=UPI0035D4E452
MIDKKVLLELISYGITASSPDNSEPFKFKLSDNEIELRLDPKYLGMFFDAKCYASLLGCGGVIENIRLRASTMGYRTLVTKHVLDKPLYRVAQLQFEPCEDSEDPLASAILKRCTHRGFYERDKTIPFDLIAGIEQSVEPLSGARVHWFEGGQRDEITRIITTTDRIRYTHKSLHDDFYSKLRYGDQIEKSSDGLASDTLGLESMFTYTLPLLKPWPVANFLNLIGMHYFMAFRGAKVPLENANRIGALIVPKEADELEQGMTLNRLWLAVNKNEGVHFQPFGAFPLLIYRMKELNGEGFNEQQKQFLQTYIQQLEELIEAQPDKERVVILFRIGYARPPRAFSRRRPVESFLIE